MCYQLKVYYLLTYSRKRLLQLYLPVKGFLLCPIFWHPLMDVISIDLLMNQSRIYKPCWDGSATIIGGYLHEWTCTLYLLYKFYVIYLLWVTSWLFLPCHFAECECLPCVPERRFTWASHELLDLPLALLRAEVLHLWWDSTNCYLIIIKSSQLFINLGRSEWVISARPTSLI